MLSPENFLVLHFFFAHVFPFCLVWFSFPQSFWSTTASNVCTSNLNLNLKLKHLKLETALIPIKDNIYLAQIWKGLEHSHSRYSVFNFAYAILSFWSCFLQASHLVLWIWEFKKKRENQNQRRMNKSEVIRISLAKLSRKIFHKWNWDSISIAIAIHFISYFHTFIQFIQFMQFIHFIYFYSNFHKFSSVPKSQSNNNKNFHMKKHKKVGKE